MGVRMLRWMAAILAVMAAGPAFADIASFNAAVKAADYRKAAAEAAATWPTLDKSREDIPLIAREFGFAAYVAKDFRAARTYSEFAASKGEGGLDGALSTVLLRLSEHKLKPSNATRDALNAALTARAAFPGFDPISYIGADSLVAYDFDRGKWKTAEASSDLAVKLTSAAGPGYSVQRHRLALFAAVAEYMSTEEAAVYDQFTAVRKAVIEEIDRAATDEAAKRFAPLYWEAASWQETLDSHLRAKGERRGLVEDPFDELARTPSERQKAVLGWSETSESCKRSLRFITMPEYPVSPLYKGLVGSVVMRADIDASGNVSNPEVLAAVPEKHFSEAAVKNLKRIRYEPGEPWDASCSMAKKGHLLTFKFMIPGR